MNTTIALKPIDRATIIRAQGADPNFQRCLIENCSRNQAIHVVHVFDREATTIQHLIEGLEWSWRMMRGTLNLDTRGNIFFLSASMHQLYRDMKWVLLPEREVVLRFFHDDGFPLGRQSFRDVEGDTFRYIFVPIKDMEDVCITRQSVEEGDKHVAVHQYPFENFPVLTSHIHPKYAILHAGKVLQSGLGWEEASALFERYPWLEEVERLYLSWKAMLNDNAERDPMFNTLKLIEGSHTSSGINSLDGTPLCRIQLLHPSKAPQSCLTPTSIDHDAFAEYISSTTAVHAPVRKSSRRKRPDDDDGNSPSPKKRPTLTSAALQTQAESDDSAVVDWTSDRVLSWARGCRSSSPIPMPVLAPVPSLPPTSNAKPFLRRSERLKAKLRKS